MLAPTCSNNSLFIGGLWSVGTAFALIFFKKLVGDTPPFIVTLMLIASF